MKVHHCNLVARQEHVLAACGREDGANWEVFPCMKQGIFGVKHGDLGMKFYIQVETGPCEFEHTG